ncbi:MAG: hypothetical protein AB3N23_11385 [Paracoccaceae bacterium]
MNVLATAGTACVLVAATAVSSLAQNLPTRPGTSGNGITISCFRGPSSNVIWDRPNAVFIEDLVRFGYTYPQAHAIGERVCRDEYGVGQPQYLRTSLLQIMAETQPTR